MKRLRWVALAAAVTVTFGSTALTAVAQPKDEALEETDVGITADEIRIAVLADVENPIAPGLFVGAPDAIAGFAKYINNSCKPKNTCLAGRKLVVDFLDTHLSANETRNALIKACGEDFAMVGTTALFVNNVDDMVNCVDKDGEATGIPDLPGFTVEFVHQCSPVSYPINPPQLDCATKDEHPQTYRVNQGSAKYHLRKNKNDLRGAFLWGNDLKSAETGGRTVIEGQKAAGIESDSETGVSGRAPRSVYTPVMQQMKSDGSNYALNMSAYNQTVAMRQEAKIQGINPDDVVWDCASQCYDTGLIEQGGADVEGQYLTLVALPFEEAKASKPVADYIKFTGKDKIDGFGEYAWIDAMLFTEVVNQIVEEGGNNALTRKAMLETLDTVHDFDADGMWGKTDIAAREGTPCFYIMQVQDGEFTRVYPKKAGTRDCKASNAREIEADLIQ